MSTNDSSSRSLKNIIPILFENEDIIIFDKPPGLLVIPSPKKEKNTLLSVVNEQLQSRHVQYRLHPCHRLDRETSGVIMFAKGKQRQKNMMDLFKQHKVEKVYVAFVVGHLKKNSGEIRGLISDLDQLKYRKHSKGKLAHLSYRVISRKKDYSILEVQPTTGRTNQIRIQLSQLGHPLVGDRKYSVVRNYPVKFKRSALHAKSIKWRDPATKKSIIVNSTLPKDMEVFCARN